MKVLLLSHRLPCPPHGGGRIRSHHILRHLSRHHEVTLAAPVRRTDSPAALEAARHLTARQCLVPVSEPQSWLRTVTALPTRRPSSFAYFHSPRLAALIRAELQRDYELVLVHCSSMAPYVGPTRAATLLDFGDMDSEKWRAYGGRRRFPTSLGFRLEAHKVRRAERTAARRFDLCTCTTTDELEALRELAEPAASGWFANGVDSAYFTPAEDGFDADAICFLGRMDYYPNREAMGWFAEHVWPLLRAERPALTLSIIGADPSPAVRRLAQQPGIRVTGSVADVRVHARRAAVSVAPLRTARGTQNKILESLAMGIPVVASPLAARGIQAEAGEHLLVAQEPAAFAAAVLRLLRDPRERQRLARAGREHVCTHHSWESSMRQLDALIEVCLEHRRSAQR